jgi:hypothetical protein
MMLSMVIASDGFVWSGVRGTRDELWFSGGHCEAFATARGRFLVLLLAGEGIGRRVLGLRGGGSSLQIGIDTKVLGFQGIGQFLLVIVGQVWVWDENEGDAVGEGINN